MNLITALIAGFTVFWIVKRATRREGPNRIDTRFRRSLEQSTRAAMASHGVTLERRTKRSYKAIMLRLFKLAVPTRMIAPLERELLLAGAPTTTQGFFTIHLSSIGAGLFLLILGVAGGAAGKQLIFYVASFGFLSFAPVLWIRSAKQRRQAAILKALPDAVDLIATTVEAGLGMDAAMAEVAKDTPGPLGEEFRISVRETALGSARRESLQRVIDRTQVPELKTFLQSIIQAERSGIPVGQVLKVQAGQMRLKRRQSAESQAQKAPVKIIMILVILVLPSMMIMVMGPAFLRLSNTGL